MLHFQQVHFPFLLYDSITVCKRLSLKKYQFSIADISKTIHDRYFIYFRYTQKSIFFKIFSVVLLGPRTLRSRLIFHKKLLNGIRPDWLYIIIIFSIDIPIFFYHFFTCTTSPLFFWLLMVLLFLAEKYVQTSVPCIQGFTQDSVLLGTWLSYQDAILFVL